MFHRRLFLTVSLALLVVLAGDGALAPVSAQPPYEVSCSSYPLPAGCPEPPEDIMEGLPPQVWWENIGVGSGQLYVEDKDHVRKTQLTDVDMPLFLVVVVPPGAESARVAIIQYFPPNYALSNYLEVPWQAISGGGPKMFGGHYMGSSDPQGKYAFKALLWYSDAGVWKYAEPIAFMDFCQPLNPPSCVPEFPLPLLSMLLTLVIPMAALRVSRRRAATR